MTRQRKAKADPPGQDSFLDVVANLVGILIILVVVIGAHAGASWTDREQEVKNSEELTRLTGEAELARDEAANRERHNLEVEQKINSEIAMAKLRDAERDRLQLLVRSAQLEVEERLKEVSQDQKTSVDLNQKIASAQTQLISLQREHEALLAQETGPNVIEHLPTPIARTVFSNEVHFRLKNDRLAFVPLNELVEEMRNEWRVKADNLKLARETVETVGPIEGFRMQYRLALVEQIVRVEFGEMRREVPEFMGFVLLPISDNLGTSVDEALATNSWFEYRLSRLDPNETTITIWVYPDSYDEFAKVKSWLFERGYPTAGWPLPDGYPIAGGPNGYRSTAQ